MKEENRIKIIIIHKIFETWNLDENEIYVEMFKIH